MKKITRTKPRQGNNGDVYELSRFAAYILERDNDYSSTFKINFRDTNKNILILNDNDGITWTAFKGNPPEYYHEKNTVHVTHYNEANKELTMYWPARKCVVDFKWDEKVNS